EGIARPVSHWLRTSASANTASQDTADATSAATAYQGQIASLILPADVAWGEASKNGAKAGNPRPAASTADEVIEDIASLIREHKKKPETIALLLGGKALIGKGPDIAGQISAKTGCKLLAEPKN